METTFSTTKKRKKNRKIYRACLTSGSRTALLHSEIVSFITSKGEKESGGLPMRLERVDEVPTKLDDETLRQREEDRGEKGLPIEIETVYRVAGDNGVPAARNGTYLNEESFSREEFEKGLNF